MSIDTHIDLLRRYNEWRRHDSSDPLDGDGPGMPDPREIGEAIDAVCEAAESARAAGNRVLAAFQRLGGIAHVREQMDRHRECEAAMLALEAALNGDSK